MSTDAVGCDQKFSNNQQKKKISFKHGFLNFSGGPADFPGGSVVKSLPVNAGDSGDEVSIPGSRRSPDGGSGNPLQYSFLGKSHGQRSLAGYSPSGFKESDRTEPQLGTGGPVVKNSPCKAKFVGSIPVRSTGTCHGPCATMKDPT